MESTSLLNRQYTSFIGKKVLKAGLLFFLVAGFNLPAQALVLQLKNISEGYWVADYLDFGTDPCGSDYLSDIYFEYDTTLGYSWHITEVSFSGCADFQPVLDCVSRQGTGQSKPVLQSFPDFEEFLTTELGTTVKISDTADGVFLTICSDLDDGTGDCDEEEIIDVWGIESGVSNKCAGEFTAYGANSLAEYIDCLMIEAAKSATSIENGKSKGKGRFVSQMAKELDYLVEVGDLTEDEKDMLVTAVVMVPVSAYAEIASLGSCFESAE